MALGLGDVGEEALEEIAEVGFEVLRARLAFFLLADLFVGVCSQLEILGHAPALLNEGGAQVRLADARLLQEALRFFRTQLGDPVLVDPAGPVILIGPVHRVPAGDDHQDARHCRPTPPPWRNANTLGSPAGTAATASSNTDSRSSRPTKDSSPIPDAVVDSLISVFTRP